MVEEVATWAVRGGTFLRTRRGRHSPEGGNQSRGRRRVPRSAPRRGNPRECGAEAGGRVDGEAVRCACRSGFALSSCSLLEKIDLHVWFRRVPSSFVFGVFGVEKGRVAGERYLHTLGGNASS